MEKYDITTKQEVLDRLGIQDWRFLTQNHYMALVGMLEKMSPAVREYVQKQLAKTALDSVKAQQDTTRTIIEQNGEVGKKAIDLSKTTVKALQEIALSDNLTESDKDKWAERIMKIEADGMKQADETRNSNNKAIAALTAVSLTALIAVGAAFGLKMDHGNSIYFLGKKRISRRTEGSRAALNMSFFLLIRPY